MSVPDQSLRRFSGYALKRAMAVVQSDINATLASLDLRMVTFSTLSVIVEHPGIKQSQLSDVLAIERPNLVLVIDELERRDLITRDRDPADRRAYCLQVTLAGRRLRDRAEAAVAKHDARMTAGLSKHELQVMNRALRQIELNGKVSHDETGISRA